MTRTSANLFAAVAAIVLTAVTFQQTVSMPVEAAPVVTSLLA